jgi:hypothetical protein
MTTTNKRVYVTIGDIHRSFEDYVLCHEDAIEYKTFIKDIGIKKQITTLMLMISDIIDKKIVLSRGLILDHESVLIPYLKSQGLTTFESHRFWWVIYDSIKNIIDDNSENIITNGIRVGPNFCINLKSHQSLLENI